MTRKAFYSGARSAVLLSLRCRKLAKRLEGDEAIEEQLEALRHLIRASYYMRSRKMIAVKPKLERLAA